MRATKTYQNMPAAMFACTVMVNSPVFPNLDARLLGMPNSEGQKRGNEKGQRRV